MLQMPALPPSRSSAQSTSCNISDILGLRRELPEFRVRMGLATGDPVVGTIGAPTARSSTVIGDTVNLASRLEGANNAYATSILVDQETFQLAQNDVEGREIDIVTVFGKVEPVRVYEIMAPAAGLSDAEQELRGVFAEGLAAYRAAMGIAQSSASPNVWRSRQGMGPLLFSVGAASSSAARRSRRIGMADK